MNDPIIRRARQVGADVLHGIESHGALSFDDTEHVLTVADGVVYWLNGTRVNTGAATTSDIDDYETLTANTLYYFYFDDTTGTLKCSESPWSINTSSVPVAAVYWNGSAGAVLDETHGYQRDLQWHVWAHTTVGSRISASDFAMTAPSVGSPSTINFAGGTLRDEDVASTFTNNTPAGMLLNCRVWYQVSAGKYTFEDSASAYPSVGAAFVDSDTGPYTLTATTAGQMANVWIYAAPDTTRPLWCFLESRTSPHLTAASARAVTPPNLSGFGLTPELKLLYRVIFDASEGFVESTDYRSSASLPAGGTTAPSAASVTFAPAGNIASTSVQTAIEELDSEKQATLTFGIADTNALRVDHAAAADNDFAKFTANGIEGRSYAETLSDIGAAAATHGHTDRIVAVFDGGGAEIEDAKKARVYVPFACTITAATILADQSGSIVVDVWKQALADWPPEDAQSITASAPPTISTATYSHDATLTNWTTAISAGDALIFNVDSCTTIQHATVVLTVTRSA